MKKNPSPPKKGKLRKRIDEKLRQNSSKAQ